MSSVQRFEKLDSLRGLAALSVFILHASNVFWDRSESEIWPLLVNSPLKIMWAGHEAVIFFFMLSGFVLSLPYFSGKQSNYKSYMIKRFFRIYIPFIIVVLLSVIARIAFSSGEVVGVWSGDITVGLIMSHVFMIGTYDTLAFDPVVWSLIHELRISIIFPFVMFFILKFSWQKSMIYGFVISSLGILITYYRFDVIDDLSNLYISAHYLLMFILGALLAKHRDFLKGKINHLQSSSKLLLLLMGVFFYCFANKIATHSIGIFIDSIITTYIADWIIMLGGSVFILIAISDSDLLAFLNKRPLLFLGKISYSFYLLHLPILLVVYSLFATSLSMGVPIIFSLGLSLVLSHLSYLYIELPSMRFGKSLTKNKRPIIEKM